MKQHNNSLTRNHEQVYKKHFMQLLRVYKKHTSQFSQTSTLRGLNTSLNQRT